MAADAVHAVPVTSPSNLSACTSFSPTTRSSSCPTARPASTPRARSGRSWPSRRCVIRADGAVQDLRAAARRRPGDPDPHHARPRRRRRPVRAPPLVGAPARRGGAAALPRREGRDRPADRERLLLRLRLPRADRRSRPRADRGRGSRELDEGRELEPRARSRATRRSARFEAEDEPYKVELVDTAEGDITLYTQGDFTDLCRGPHLQNSAPIKAFKLTGLAGAYWRGDEHNKQLDPHLRHRVLLAGRPRRLPRAARAGARARPPQARRAARPLPPLRPLARVAVLAPEGNGDLERARGPAPPREPAARATSR